MPGREPAPRAGVVPGGQDRSGWISGSRQVVLPPPRAGIAALAVLSPAGFQALGRYGHARVAAEVAPGVPAPRVRFVDSALAAGLSRADDAALIAIFDAPRPRLPVLTSSVAAPPSGVLARLRIPPDLHALHGHFAAMPIVPGAIQVGWAIEYAGRLLGIRGQFAGLESTKFRRIIQPGRAVELSLDWRPERHELRFEYRSAGGRFSLGRILLDGLDA